MAKALALTAECLSRTKSTPTLGGGGSGPSIIPRNLIPVTSPPTVPGGGTTTGDRPVTVLPGTSALPSSGPQVQPPPPTTGAPTAPGPRWGLWLGLGALLALVLLAGRDRPRAR